VTKLPDPLRSDVLMPQWPLTRTIVTREFVSWIYLCIAIAAEVVATSAFHASHGFSRLWPSVIAVAGYVVSLFFLSLTLRAIPVGLAYAIWSGAGIALIAVIGVVVFRQPLDLPAVIGLVLIVCGVLVIHHRSHSITQ
jgi:small multidrug resistance pump